MVSPIRTRRLVLVMRIEVGVLYSPTVADRRTAS